MQQWKTEKKKDIFKNKIINKVETSNHSASTGKNRATPKSHMIRGKNKVMKTRNLLLAFVIASAIAFSANAQTQPPNAGFENWVTVGTGENPTGWSSFNNLSIYSVPIMSFKTTDANSGTYALRLISQTATIPPPLGTNTLDTIAGYVFVGGFDMNHPGIPYTDRPVLMQAYVKGTIITGSEAYLMATLSKWNTGTHTRDQVGFAMYYTSSSIASYSQISVPFNYSLPDTPDTLDIKIMAGNVGPGGVIMPGNEFFVDDLSFTFPVGINETNIDNSSLNIFPNPASDKVTINSADKINAIEIYNMLGENVYTQTNLSTSASNEIGLSNFQKGIYFVKIYQSEKICTEKIVIQ